MAIIKRKNLYFGLLGVNLIWAWFFYIVWQFFRHLQHDKSETQSVNSPQKVPVNRLGQHSISVVLAQISLRKINSFAFHGVARAISFFRNWYADLVSDIWAELFIRFLVLNTHHFWRQFISDGTQSWFLSNTKYYVNDW